jgi:hypothetical protein
MGSNLKTAIIVAVGLVAASLVFSGIYSTRTAKDAGFLWRVNRFTGAVVICSITQPGDDDTFAPSCWNVRMKEGAPTR